MFKVYYDGKLVSDQEFKNITEAKKAVAPMLAGQKGLTTQDVLNLRDEDGKRLFQVVGKYEYPMANPVERVCPICGKKFYVPSEKSLKKLCSAECRKKHTRQYNTDYCKKIYHTDADRRAKMLASNLMATKRNVAKKRWARRTELADTILILATQPDARDLIATFLDKKVINNGVGRNIEFRSEPEVEAEKKYYATMDRLTESIGDLTKD